MGTHFSKSFSVTVLLIKERRFNVSTLKNITYIRDCDDIY